MRAFSGCAASWLLGELRSKPSDYYLVGGAVRDVIREQKAPQDLDLVVPNEDTFVHEMLSSHGESRRNRHGNWRYQLESGFHIDVIEPRYFYQNFATPREVLAYFDASVNAIGVRLHDGHVIDPIGGLKDLLAGSVRLPEERWTSMDNFESVHLILRLTRLLKRLRLRLINPELAMAQLPKFGLVDWTELFRLNGITELEARRTVETTLSLSATMSFPDVQAVGV
jgi:tRNA nucleotidyltransferase/poly(A) polymerase